MWLRNLLLPNQPVAQQPPAKQSSNFQQQSIQQGYVMTSAIILDIQPDNRYKKFKQIPKSSCSKMPMMEVHDTQRIFMCEVNLFNCRIHQSDDWEQVNLMMTDRQLIISPNVLYSSSKKTLNYCSINYGSIQKSQQVMSKKKQAMKLKITLKCMKQIYFKCILGDLIMKIDQILKQFAFVKGINKFYAYKFGDLNRDKEKEFKGWKIYNVKREFIRQGFFGDGQERVNLKYVSNQFGELCQTYPQFLVVPSKITDAQLKKCAQFRTKERFPALTYFLEYKNNRYCGLFRCSQNKVGVLYARSKQDQLMIQYIGQLTQQPQQSLQPQQKPVKTCKIYDARGYYAALGNMIAGKGFQKPQFYKNCQIKWLNIPNIHAVRESYNTLMNYRKSEHNLLALCAQSGWYDYLYLIIAGAKEISRDLLAGVNVVVHCSDGWDRTSQLCALSQLILDPYYRTIEGFGVLIEKDWRHFGHKFRERTGQYNPTQSHPYQQSPIFIQFLDCVYQIMQQFPLSFQFSQRLLQFLAKNVDSSIYGNFMTNNIQQHKQLQLQHKTISIWSHILQNIQIFKNPFYQPDLNQFWLNVGTQPKNITIWRAWFLSEVEYSSNVYQIMRFEVERRGNLRARYQDGWREIEELRGKLQALEAEQ